jgi:hypothetical protein
MPGDVLRKRFLVCCMHSQAYLCLISPAYVMVCTVLLPMLLQTITCLRKETGMLCTNNPQQQQQQ